MITIITQHMDAFLKLANIIAILFAAYKFTKKPQESMSERLDALEEKVDKLETEVDLRQKDFEQQLRQGNDKFRSINKILEVLLTCTLALINFEVHYCESEHKDISEDLEDARKVLNKVLSTINKEDVV